jgi:putative phosphoesterase
VTLVGVMSDSHDNLKNVRKVLKIFEDEGIGVLIHLGDIVSPFTLRLIGEWARFRSVTVEAVYGNNCGEKLGLLRVATGLGINLGEPPRTIEIGGRRILLVHGFGSRENTLEIVNALAVSNRWDIILYGHTHEPDLRRADGTLILNPGETGATLGPASIAVLDTEKLAGRIIPL